MYIILDTNIWLSQFVLNSSAGAAVRFYIQKSGAQIVIPEVVCLELERHLTRDMKTWRDGIEADHRKLLRIFGQLKEIVLPTDEEIQGKASAILDQLDIPTRKIPFSLSAARASLKKVIEKLPPSSKNKQNFTDGVIWAHCVELLKEADVYLVTDDTDFYQDKQNKTRLASNLHEEVRNYQHKLRLIPSLGELLKSIKQNVEVDDANIWKDIWEGSAEQIQKPLNEAGFYLEGLPDISKNLFLTEDSTRLYVEFDIQCRCLDETNQGRLDAILQLKGSGSYDTANENFLNIRLSNLHFQYSDEEGKKRSTGVVYLSGNFVYGHGSVKHTLQLPLENNC